MDFRLKQLKVSRKVRKEWHAPPYKVVGVREVCGVKTPAHFFALVQVVLPSGRTMWDFCERRGPYKTQTKAMEACDKHSRLWRQAAEAAGVRDIERIFGKVPCGVPLKSTLKRSVRELLETHYDC